MVISSRSLLTGVYKIVHVDSGKVYVGSTSTSFHSRFSSHRNDLTNNRHGNSYLQRAWNKYGKDKFKFTIVEICNKNSCVEREQFWIDHYKSCDRRRGFNLAPTAGSMLGYRHTRSSKTKISAATKTAMTSEQVRKRLKEGHKKRSANPRLGQRIKEGICQAIIKDPSMPKRRRISQCNAQKKRFDKYEERRKYSVLTEEAILSIRSLYVWRHKDRGSYGLAKRFGVSQRTIMSVIKRKTWLDQKHECHNFFRKGVEGGNLAA